MGLLQGPRLMAWTTKIPIRGNHWVPLGCRALLGSVKCSPGARGVKMTRRTQGMVCFCTNIRPKLNKLKKNSKIYKNRDFQILFNLSWILAQKRTMGLIHTYLAYKVSNLPYCSSIWSWKAKDQKNPYYRIKLLYDHKKYFLPFSFENNLYYFFFFRFTKKCFEIFAYFSNEYYDRGNNGRSE